MVQLAYKTMDQVAQVREKIDIVALISDFITLKKTGQNFKGLCPFHGEKTPSFVVSPQRQIWHCFGCNKGGDCFTFLMEYEHLEFGEALRILAKKAGIMLEAFRFESETVSKKELIYTINRLACEYYHYVLMQHAAGENPKKYLFTTRGIKQQTAETFLLGFAPKTGNALVRYLIGKKKLKKEDIIATGLASVRGDSIQDFFVNRVIFPLIDHRDNVVGFAGRTTTENAYGPKYVNTRETLVYHKSDILFGLNIAKESIKKENHALLMEGELDVISSFQAGVTNAVAVKGTALTEAQVNLIARFAGHVLLSLDQDLAGKEALKRSITLLEKKGLTANVVILQNGKDPDEAARNNPLLFKKSIKESIGAYDFLLSDTLHTFDPKSAIGKKQISDKLLPFFANIQNEIVKEHYLKKLADSLETSYESMEKQVEKVEEREKPTTLAKTLAALKKPREEVLQEYLLALLVQQPHGKISLDMLRTILDGPTFTTPVYEKLFHLLQQFFAANDVFDSKVFSSQLPMELRPTFDICYLLPLPKFTDSASYNDEIKKVADELKFLSVRERIKTVTKKIKDKEKSGESDNELDGLQEEFSNLAKELQQ